MCMGVLSARMSVCHMYAVPKEGIRSPETGVTDGCEPLCRYWELNQEKKPVLLTTELSL